MAAISQLGSREVALARPRVRSLSSAGDVQLMARIARADADALAELYDRHGGIAYGLALRVTRDRGLAEEAVQDGFLSVWRSAGSFDRRLGAPRSWLLTLVHRRAVDRVRRASRQLEQPEPWPLEVGGPSAAETAELGAERLRVRRALDGLPSAQRQALELAYYGGLTQAQIAERVGVPLGTVKSRMFAALAALRAALTA